MKKIYEICALVEDSDALENIFSEIEKTCQVKKRESFGEKQLFFPIKKSTVGTLGSIWIAKESLKNARQALSTPKILRFIVLSVDVSELEKEPLSYKIEERKKKEEAKILSQPKKITPSEKVTETTVDKVKKTKKKLSDTPSKQAKPFRIEKKPKLVSDKKIKPTLKIKEMDEEKRLEDLDKKLEKILSDDINL